MAFSAAAVANELLYLARVEGRDLTQVSLHRLMYFAHGWYLGLTDEPLFFERTLAWEYGPVVREVSDELRHYGGGFITDPIRAGGHIVRMTVENPDEAPKARAVVGEVWKRYGGMAALRLVAMTHHSNGPWAQARARAERVISDQSIREYFAQLISLDDRSDRRRP